MTKRLAAFDFDHTISELNTDLVVRDLVSAGYISDRIKEIYKTYGWTMYMREIFKLLHEKRIKKENIEDAIKGIPEVEGIKNCIKFLAENNFDIIIISDSNSEFIRIWNEHNEITEYIHSVFTNKAHFDDKGRLHIAPFGHQTECKLSAINICKGKVLQKFIENQTDVAYDKVFYIGDGKNDVCPILRLPENSYGCAREGYSCIKELNKMTVQNPKCLKAKLYIWKNGIDLQTFIENEINS